MTNSQTGDEIDHQLHDERDSGAGCRQHAHRYGQQQHVGEQVSAEVAVQSPLQWGKQPHAVILDAIISSAMFATRPAAPGDPSFSPNAFSAATVSGRIVSLNSGSAARTSFSAVTSPWISSGTICRPARI